MNHSKAFPGAAGAVEQSRTRRKKAIGRIMRDRQLILLALPGAAFMILFKYVPLWGLIIAFMDYSPYRGLLHSDWVGLAHFRRFFENSDFILLFRNTLGINLLSLIFFFPLPIILSLLLNEVRNMAFKRFVQSIVYLPHFLSWVIIAGLCFLLLGSEGVVNKLIAAAGMQQVDFLTNPKLFWILLTAQSIWKEAGWGTIIFLAAIAGVDSRLYEAARIDGAGRLRQAWHITLPAIRGVIVVLFILRMGHMMDVGFEQVYLMANGAVADVADVFDTYVYRLGIQQSQYSFTSAVGLFKSVIGFILVLLANSLSKRFGEEGVY
nr:ABC transporter permease subunit [Paenibacillus sp. UNC496MF]